MSTTAQAAEGAPMTRDFEAFYRAEMPAQVRRAALLLGSDEAADDVVHDALAAMYRRWDRIADPGPYFNRAVLNGCRDRGRRVAARGRMLDRLRARPSDQAESDHLTDVLGRLPFNQRAAVVLRFYGGCSAAEIAEQLDCPIGSVGPWIERGLRRLREELS